HRMIHRDGGIRWMLCRGLAVRDSSDAVYRMAGSMSDVTRRKTAEEELVKKERLATIGMTISNAAHSMKNVLVGVNGGYCFNKKEIGYPLGWRRFLRRWRRSSRRGAGSGSPRYGRWDSGGIPR